MLRGHSRTQKSAALLARGYEYEQEYDCKRKRNVSLWSLPVQPLRGPVLSDLPRGVVLFQLAPKPGRVSLPQISSAGKPWECSPERSCQSTSPPPPSTTATGPRSVRGCITMRTAGPPLRTPPAEWIQVREGTDEGVYR